MTLKIEVKKRLSEKMASFIFTFLSFLHFLQHCDFA